MTQSSPNTQSAHLQSIVKTFPDLVTFVFGNLDIKVVGPCSQDNPLPNSLLFISDEKRFLRALESPAAAIVLPHSLKKIAEEKALLVKSQKTLLASNNIYLAMAQINSTFFALPFLRQPFEPLSPRKGCFIDPLADVHESAIIQPGVVVMAHAKIGKNTFVGSNSVIEAHAWIGENCFLHPLVYVGHTCRIGNRVEIKPHSTVGSDGFGYAHDAAGNHYRIPHYGAVIIEDDVHIGANVNIDRGTYDPARIGSGTKIDNYCHLGHNAQIGKNCLITAGMITAGSVKIGDNCVFGGRATVNGHISITSNVLVGGLSGVNKSITKPGKYGGFPITEYKAFLKMQSSMTQLPQMRRKITQIMSRLGIKLKTGENE